MSDSRQQSIRIFSSRKIKWQFKNRAFLFFASLVISILSVYFFKPDDFTQPQIYTLFILIFAALLWITEGIPPFAVGILIIGFLVYSMGSLDISPVDPKKYTQTWSDNVIWVFLGGFFLSEGMRKTRLDVALFRLTVSIFGEKPRYILLGIMLISAFLSMIMSNTATTAMVIAAVMPFLNQLNKDNKLIKAILISIPASTSIGGMGTIIGTPPNLIIVEALRSKGIIISFLDWMLIGIPVAVILVFLFWLAVCKKFIDYNTDVDLTFLSKSSIKNQEHKLKIIFVSSILFVTIGLWMTSNLHTIPTAAVAGIPIVFLTMGNIITGDDVRTLPWDTLMLVAGGLALGIAIKEILAPYYSMKLNSLNIDNLSLLIIFSLVTIFFSNIMSNTATATIVINIAIVMLPIDELLRVSIAIALSASCALFLPVSTPPNAVAFATGKIKQADFRFGGLFVGTIGAIIIILWVLLIDKLNFL